LAGVQEILAPGQEVLLCQMPWMQHRHAGYGIKLFQRFVPKRVTGIVQRLKDHADACEKLQEQGLWEKSSAPPDKKQKQSKLPFGGPPSVCVLFPHLCHQFRKADSLELQVGKFLFATNSSFRVAEHPQFAKLVEMLQPKAKLPGRRAIGGRILTTVYDTEWAKFVKSVEGVSSLYSPTK
jgi:hypothetical protein